MKKREQSSGRIFQRIWQAIAIMGSVTLVAVLLGLGLPAGSTAYAASSAEQKGQEYAQEDPGYQTIQEASGSTQYYLDIEEPEPEPSSIDTGEATGLPKTGDSTESRLLLMGFGGLGVMAIAGLCVALWPRKHDDDDLEPEDDPFKDDEL